MGQAFFLSLLLIQGGLGHWPPLITVQGEGQEPATELELIKARDEMLQDILLEPDPVTSNNQAKLEDFLWSGSGEGEVDLDTTTPHDINGIQPSRQTQPVPGGANSVDYFAGPTLPKEEFLVRTVLLSNMTIINRGIEHFKESMEQKLTKAYQHAYQAKRYRRDITRRGRREVLPSVVIHNIRSSLPEPEIEMIYTVVKEDELVLAETAVEALCHVDDMEVAQVLGFPLVTKAEPYTARAAALTTHHATATNNWLIGAVILTTCVAVCVLAALLLLLHRYRLEETRHRRLMASPGGSSSQDNASHVSAGSSGGLDPGSFGLAKPGPLDQTHHSFVSSGLGPGQDLGQGQRGLTMTKHELISSGEELFKPREAQSRNSSLLGEESPSLADLSSNNTPETQKRPRKVSKKSQNQRGVHKRSKKVGSDSVEIDQSAFPVRTPDKEGFLGPLSDLLEEEIQLPGESREHSAGAQGNKNWAFLPKRRKSPSVSSSTSGSGSCDSQCRGEQDEEEVEVTVATTAQSSSVFVLSPCDTTTAEAEMNLSQSPSDATGTDIKRRTSSAKSHVFRKNKVEASRPVQAVAKATTAASVSSQQRPWSAHESRLQADPIFAMRQRHWEGLIAGKKTLHRGQLLPGSTSEEELKEALNNSKSKPVTCWSELSSPRKQVRIQEPLPTLGHPTTTNSSSNGATDGESDPTGPIIQAIRQELQRFQRPKSPNLTGITVINDPELLKRESDA